MIFQGVFINVLRGQPIITPSPFTGAFHKIKTRELGLSPNEKQVGHDGKAVLVILIVISHEPGIARCGYFAG